MAEPRPEAHHVTQHPGARQVETDVLAIVGSIWSAILDLEVAAGPQAVEAARRAQSERSLTSCVQVTGTWEGSVLLYSTYRLAQKMAAIMFDVPLEDLTDEEVEDAMGELGNMTAGNVKKLFAGPCQISLPAVVDGVDYRLLVPGSTDWCKVLVECDGEPVLVTVLQKDEEHSPGTRVRAVST